MTTTRQNFDVGIMLRLSYKTARAARGRPRAGFRDKPRTTRWARRRSRVLSECNRDRALAPRPRPSDAGLLAGRELDVAVMRLSGFALPDGNQGLAATFASHAGAQGDHLC
jgi:hypothetical protein